jgi:hypothetical protein
MHNSSKTLQGSLLAFFLIAVAGCSSWNKPASESFASVLITNVSPDEIHKTTIKVFQEADYLSYYRDPTQDLLVFEKEGTQGESYAYNGVVGTQYGQITLNRVKVRFVSRADGSCRVNCQAFIVRDASSRLGGEEIRVSNLRSGPYQKLLDEVAERLKNPKP